MPFRLDPTRAKMQFTTSAEMPWLVYQACLRTGIVSNTVYCQHALCEALARDLGLSLSLLHANLPTPRGPAAHLFDPREGRLNRYHRSIVLDHDGGVHMTGPANTQEEVR